MKADATPGDRLRCGRRGNGPVELATESEAEWNGWVKASHVLEILEAKR